MSERQTKAKRSVGDLSEAVQALGDDMMLINMHLSALTELVCEASISGRPITREGVEKRRDEILERTRKEWQRMQTEPN